MEHLLSLPKSELVSYGYTFFGGVHPGDKESLRMVSFWENDYKTKYIPREIEFVFLKFVEQLTDKSLKTIGHIFYYNSHPIFDELA